MAYFVTDGFYNRNIPGNSFLHVYRIFDDVYCLKLAIPKATKPDICRALLV